MFCVMGTTPEIASRNARSDAPGIVKTGVSGIGARFLSSRRVTPAIEAGVAVPQKARSRCSAFLVFRRQTCKNDSDHHGRQDPISRVREYGGIRKLPYGCVPMKIGLYTFGGPSIGTGHLFRCIALAEWLERLPGHKEICFEIIDHDPDGPKVQEKWCLGVGAIPTDATVILQSL